MTIYHNHHIIPRYMGGSDDPSNLIKVTIEEHAEAHRILYEKYGNPQDYAAWKGLSGTLGKEEIIKYIQSECSKISNKNRVENGTHNFQGERNPSKKKVKLGIHHFQQNIGNRPADIAQRLLISSGNHYWQSKEHSENVGMRTKEAITNNKHPFGQTISCPHCGKIGQKSAMKRWHFDKCSNVSS